MPIIGAYIMPHGALALTPYLYPEFKELPLINKSCCKVAEEIYFSNPEIILLTTPHGVALTKSFGIYMNSAAEGSAEWEGEWKDFKVKIDISLEDSKSLLNNLEIAGIPSEGIVSYSDDEKFPLRWGETIPLWFVSQPYNNYTLKPLPKPKCVIISMPRTRLTEPENIIDNCLNLGKEIFEYFNKLDKRVVIITSADMAHTHVKSQSANKEDEADLFDKSIELWASNPILNENILIECSKLVTTYLSCGYTGMVVLHGVLQQIDKSNHIKTEILCNEHPTYYGMMVAKFNFN